MRYPLVRELAGDGIPVTVTCRVLEIARQPYYRWLAQPVTDVEWVQAHRANALFDDHPGAVCADVATADSREPQDEAGCHGRAEHETQQV
jgi:hypothetical protein